MSTKRCYYEVLNVSRSASQGEIEASYRKLALKFHPDRNPGDEEAEEKFKECAEALEVLRDSEKRARYDQMGHAAFEGGAGQGYHDVSDIFDMVGDLFGDMFGGGGGRRNRVQRGRDIRADVTLTLEEAYTGVDREISFQRSVECKTCDGSGAAPGSSPQTCRQCNGHGQVIQSGGILRVQTTCPVCRGAGVEISDPCTDCRGRGFNTGQVEVNVNIPAGVDTGMHVRVAGQGQPSPNGGPPGDCHCVVKVREHDLFQRDGQHLILRLPITYSQAALGATIEVPTLDGPANLKVHKGTQSGELFPLRGKGMPDPHGRRPPGDLVVQANIETPKKLSSRQEELLRELAELENVDVTPQRQGFLDKLRGYFTVDDSKDEVKIEAVKEEE